MTRSQRSGKRLKQTLDSFIVKNLLDGLFELAPISLNVPEPLLKWSKIVEVV